MTDEIQKLNDIINNLRSKLELQRYELQQAKDQVTYYRTREDRLWQTLMAISAVLRGSPLPPMPEVTESYYPSYIMDAKKVYDQANSWWWRRWR